MTSEPRQATDEDVSELHELQKLYSGDKSLERAQEFAKWVFGSAATVLALGTVFGAITFEALGEQSQLYLLVATALAALALVCATVTLTPHPPRLKDDRGWKMPGYWDPTELLAALTIQVRSVRRWARASGFFFALALAVAGFGPLASLNEEDEPAGPPRTRFSYTLEERTLATKASVEELKAGAYITLEATLDPPTDGPMPKAGTVADAEGKAELNLVIQELPDAATLVRLELKSDEPEERTLAFDNSKLRPFAKHEIPIRAKEVKKESDS